MTAAEPLPVDGIRWTLDPMPPIEVADLVPLNDFDLLLYVLDLRQETALLRATLSEALALLQRANLRDKRYQTRIAALVTDLRGLRAAKPR